MLPFTWSAFRHQVHQREEPYRLAANLRLDDAIVVIQVTSGIGNGRLELAALPQPDSSEPRR